MINPKRPGLFGQLNTRGSVKLRNSQATTKLCLTSNDFPQCFYYDDYKQKFPGKEIEFGLAAVIQL